MEVGLFWEGVIPEKKQEIPSFCGCWAQAELRISNDSASFSVRRFVRTSFSYAKTGSRNYGGRWVFNQV